MKNFIKIMAVIFAVLLVSCGTTKIPQGNLQREDLNLPRWAGEGITFFSTDAEVYGAPRLSENGFCACGVSENLENPRLTASAARLSANRALAGFIKTQIVSNEIRTSNNTKITYKQIDESKIDTELVGARVIDNYTDKFGNIYALVFISEDDLKKNIGLE